MPISTVPTTAGVADSPRAGSRGIAGLAAGSGGDGVGITSPPAPAPATTPVRIQRSRTRSRLVVGGGRGGGARDEGGAGEGGKPAVEPAAGGEEETERAAVQPPARSPWGQEVRSTHYPCTCCVFFSGMVGKEGGSGGVRGVERGVRGGVVRHGSGCGGRGAGRPTVDLLIMNGMTLG